MISVDSPRPCSEQSSFSFQLVMYIDLNEKKETTHDKRYITDNVKDQLTKHRELVSLLSLQQFVYPHVLLFVEGAD